MHTQQPSQLRTASTPKIAFTLVQSGLLQRKCACGGTPGLDSECAECRKKRLGLQMVASSGQQSGAAPGVEQNTQGSRRGHHFGTLRVHPLDRTLGQGGPLDKNATEDPEPLDEEEPSSGAGALPERSQVLLGQLAPTEFPETPAAGEIGLTLGAVPLDQGGAPKVKCPTKTVVEKVTDMTPDGIKKGYRTGYGAVATMKVEPDSTNWDGAQIVEALKQTKSDCPKEFGIAPCSGNSTFTVGAEANSSVLGKLPATQNRFYDFHISRWNKGSLLHDRNPDGINACSVECEQTYACNGNAIGKHTITRTFTKGTSGSRDVTLVAVTKK